MDKKQVLIDKLNHVKRLLTGSIRVSMLMPVVIVVGIIIYAFNTTMTTTADATIGQRFINDVSFAKQYYNDALRVSQDRLAAQLQTIISDEPLQVALRNGDREALLRHAGPVYNHLRHKHGISHLFFNDLKRVNVLRLHNPAVYGDRIDRISVKLAETTGEPAFGVEMNPAGHITMRAVSPVFDKAGIAGYAELSEDFDNIMAGFKHVTAMDYTLLLNKQLLDQKLWVDRSSRLGLDANWERLQRAVVSRETLKLNSNTINYILNARNATGSYVEIAFNGVGYYADVIPVQDVSGNSVGMMIVMKNSAAYPADVALTTIYQSLLYGFLGLVLMLILFLGIRRVEFSLQDAEKKLKAAKLEKIEFEREVEAQHEENLKHIEEEKTKLVAELEEEHKRLMESQTSLQQNAQDLNLASIVFDNSSEGIMITDPETKIVRVNQAFTEITGYSEEDVLGHTPQILKSGRHDSDFFQAMWASLLEHGNWQGEVWNARKTGDIYPEWLSLSAIRDENKHTIYYLGLFSDLTEKKQAEARNQELYNYDSLTSLPNRYMLEGGLKHELSEATRHSWAVALLHLNLDRFKTVIDTLGHPFGDKVLQAVAERLMALVRDSDLLARFAGDEFEIALCDVGNEKNAAMVAQKILNALGKPFMLEDQEVYLTASIGISMYPGNADNHDDLIRCANIAARHAREDGGNGYHFYADEMNASAEQRLTLENSLRRALDNEEFVLHYQPQVDLQSGEVIAIEALLRWQDPERGMVYPDEYIPVLEETGLIVPVGDWVLHTACSQAAAWREQGASRVRIAVNLSVRQFRQNDLVKSICWILEDTGLPADALELEITESVLVQDIPATITVLNQLHELGIQTSIDDFGTGYSSLSYLQRLPISKIKIDRSFIKDIGTPKDDGSIASAVILLAHSLKMTVIAEGVETIEQLEYLHQRGCDEIQGYYFSRPKPADRIADMLERGITLDNIEEYSDESA